MDDTSPHMTQSHQELAAVYAFLGNSLLKPMTQTEAVGLDPTFWAEFPDFGDSGVIDALEALEEFAAAVGSSDHEDAVTAVSVEFTRLFIGPPSPAAEPWETIYKGSESESGFGGPTHAMRARLRELGIELSNENHQFEDHMGIELLYLSELYRRGSGDPAAFIKEHPLSWIDALIERVHASAPHSYYQLLLDLTRALLANEA